MEVRQPVCHNCRWKPITQIHYWECDCGEHFNVFTTGGTCPVCDTLVAAVQCPECALIKSLGWWLGKNGDIANDGVIAFTIVPNPSAVFLERASAWLSNREKYVASNILTRLGWLNVFLNSEISFSEIDDFMFQVAHGNGFSLGLPVRNLGLNVIQPAISFLGGRITNQGIPKAGITEEGITDEYTVELLEYKAFKFYHFIASNEV